MAESLNDSWYDWIILVANDGEFYNVLRKDLQYHSDRQATPEEIAQFCNHKALEHKLSELEMWFNDYFAMQLQQKSWQGDYKPSYDDYFGVQYADFDAVKAQASIVRAKIAQIKPIVENTPCHNTMAGS